ncbi:Flp family type IVb pilin [Erythrobacter sp. YT30]|uniref:Flp family type IVb pilin n=1 Tax=Erythrobacter sp. YT30 TaxID=1735012 RepID=UPI00076C4D0D|nr:Flp family type IVb pilin [Erythrobacter sp. YT30]KWV92778.1 pilus assembly protein [Erythrobacter sp. YT30]
MKLTTFLKTIGADNSGATAVEYGLIVSLIVLAMIGAFTNVADSNNGMWNNVSTAYEEAASN